MLSILQAHNPPYFGVGQKNYQKTVEPDKISNIFTYKKNFGMNATTDKYNVQKNLHSPTRKSLSTVHRLASNDLRHDVHTRP